MCVNIHALCPPVAKLITIYQLCVLRGMLTHPQPDLHLQDEGVSSS